MAATAADTLYLNLLMNTRKIKPQPIRQESHPPLQVASEQRLAELTVSAVLSSHLQLVSGNEIIQHHAHAYAGYLQHVLQQSVEQFLVTYKRKVD